MDVKQVEGNLVMTRKSTLYCGANPSEYASFKLELVCGFEKAPVFLDGYKDPCTTHI